jgi:hypothetical protein
MERWRDGGHRRTGAHRSSTLSSDGGDDGDAKFYGGVGKGGADSACSGEGPPRGDRIYYKRKRTPKKDLVKVEGRTVVGRSVDDQDCRSGMVFARPLEAYSSWWRYLVIMHKDQRQMPL